MKERNAVDAVVEELLAGRPVVLPTDTVYGLAASPHREEPVRHLYELKGRDDGQPVALVAADVDMLLELVPELRGRAGVIARALLPGPFTLVVPNPRRRYPWLAGTTPDALGVRVPELVGPPAAVLQRVSAVAATSANFPGGPDPRRLEDVPDAIRSACVALDGGELPGVPSTVVDVTRTDPVVLREGAVPVAETLDRIRAAVT